MKYVEKYADEVAAFLKVCHHLADKMFVTGYGGNAAWKLEDDLIDSSYALAKEQYAAFGIDTDAAIEKALSISLDFNPSFHAHPKANDGFTLSNADADIRAFWIEHGKRARKIAEAMAESQGTPCNINFWVPDGAKDLVADRFGPRQRLAESYDAIFADTSVDEAKCVDFVESKLFGIGSEEYVVGSHDFYTVYSLTRKKRASAWTWAITIPPKPFTTRFPPS